MAETSSCPSVGGSENGALGVPCATAPAMQGSAKTTQISRDVEVENMTGDFIYTPFAAFVAFRSDIRKIREKWLTAGSTAGKRNTGSALLWWAQRVWNPNT